MADKNADQLKIYYTELAKLAPSQDWQSILKVAKKIIGVSVNEKLAFHTKIVCLIHLDKFDEALTSLERFTTAGPTEFLFEKAYCEYRLNKINEAYATLRKCQPEMSTRERELFAQVTYRLEKFDESYDAYCDVIKSTEDDYDTERQTNLSAVVYGLNITNSSYKKNLDMSKHETKTFELCYNSASIQLSKCEYSEAEAKLDRAIEMCKKTFENDEEFDENDLENELAIIKVQKAYCLQMNQKLDEALKLNNAVLKNKPSDVSVVAVASNNVVTLNKDQNIFDSKKRIKTASGVELEHKLNSVQRKAVAHNEILLAINANQYDLATKLLDQFRDKFKDETLFTKIKATLLCKEKRFDDAEKLLSAYCNGNNDNTMRFYLLQLLLSRNRLQQAIDVVKTIDSYLYYPGLVSFLVSLYNKLNLKDEASILFQTAIDFVRRTDPSSSILQVYLKQNANYQIKLGAYEKAAEMIEILHEQNPSDYKLLSQLINVYSRFNENKAKALSEKLPPLEKVFDSSDIDVDQLEKQFSLLGSKYSKSKQNKDDLKPKSPDVVVTDLVKKKKSKKKRKVKLPKNIDPKVPIDAERWLALRERSYYKGKRKKKNQNVGKGTQGAVSSDTQQQSPVQSPITSPKGVQPDRAGTASSTATTATAPQQPPKAKPKAAQQKNKKKGNKW